MITGLSLCANVLVAEAIHPISREQGSGTRGAFTEIFHIQEENALITDFLDYAVSAKDVIEKAGYILAAKPAKFSSKKPAGKLRVVGSSSITPLMQKIAESYKSVNPNATIEISQSDSTTGVNSIVEGIADIGMVSRDLKPAELEKGIKNRVLAIDGLAVIVNKKNPVKNVSKEKACAR